jgi:energy-coupling factor transport system substrate-specific component
MTGFTTGWLTALISNLFIGHGPWTPWQMLAWGIIGMLAALIGKSKWGRKPFLLAIYGILSGFLYSMMMDIYTILTLWESMSIPYAFTVWGLGLLYNIPHSIGNGIFILILYKPFSRKLLRLKNKYGILNQKGTNYNE